MKTAITTILLFFSICVLGQQSSMKNQRNVMPHEVINKLEQLSVITYSSKDDTQKRHYGIDSKELYEAFGDDGVGIIGGRDNFSKDELVFIAIAAAQALKIENDDLKQKMQELEDQIVDLMEGPEEINEPELPEDKLFELQEQIKILEVKISALEGAILQD